MESSSIVQTVELDFGKVEVGVTKTMSIKIVNHSNKIQEYSVQRDSMTNPLDNVFNTAEHSWSLNPLETYLCDINYRPVIPNRKYVDYFFITDACRCCYKVEVQGFCIGPQVKSSTSRVVLISDNTDCKAKGCLKLTNNGTTSAKFIFDVDNITSSFKISERSGVLKPSSNKCIAILFEPDEVGIYKCHIPCLILNQDPIIIEAYGIYGHNLNQQKIQNFCCTVEQIERLDETIDFAIYMRYVTNVMKSEPPLVSLSTNIIDFGYARIGERNSENCTPHTVCVTNHLHLDAFIFWESDQSGVFSIQPQDAKVRGNQSVIFEIHFDPRENNKFYCRKLSARIFHTRYCENTIQTADALVMTVVPEFISIRLIGHTCSASSNNWIPQYEIPEKVTMPACLPALPVYTTFALRNFGQQPLLFRFIPPRISYYTVEPMIGLITPQQEFQVIVVQLFPGLRSAEAYMERWAVQLNGDPKNEIFVDFQGFAEEANLVFGEENSVTFDPVQMNCQKTKSVLARNTSRHLVKYSYVNEFPGNISIVPMSGSIHPNEAIFHEWTFMPNQVKKYEFTILCSLSTEMSDKQVLKKIKTSASCMEGYLMAIPDEINLGDLTYNSTSEKEFRIFNFSPVTIDFLLNCQSTKSLDIMKNPEDDLNISPKRGKIDPGKGQTIQIIFRPMKIGFYEMTLGYRVDCPLENNSKLLTSKSRDIVKLTGMSYLPRLRVKDLLYRAETREVISKLSLWKKLHIDELNEALASLLPYEETSIQMVMPYVSHRDNEKLIIKIVLENPNPIDASWTLKQKKTCLCSNKGRSSKGKGAGAGCLHCHRDQSLTIYPKDVALKPNETHILTIESNGNTLTPCGTFWDINIENGRRVTLNFVFEDSRIRSEYNLKFEKEYIGQCSDMKFKAVWLKNHEEREIEYSVDTRCLARYNMKNRGVIFSCLNSRGTIYPFEKKPVFFGFCANRIGKFESVACVEIGDEESILRIEAESTIVPQQKILTCEHCPFSDTVKCPEMIAYFNRHCINVTTASTHGKAIDMIMIHNNHSHDVLQYTWKNYDAPGMIKVEVTPTRGLIQPQNIATFLIEITTYSHECVLDIDIPCYFLDVSERRCIERKKKEKEHILKQSEDEFVITEKGISYPKYAFDAEKKPASFHIALTLRISVCDLQKFNVLQRLKNPPPFDITNDFALQNEKLKIKVKDISSLILENTMWNIIGDIWLTSMAQSDFLTDQDIKYSQFPEKVVRARADKIENNIPKRTTEDILHDMIWMIVHEEFNLETNHFRQSPDVRQMSYRKAQSKIHHKLSELY